MKNFLEHFLIYVCIIFFIGLLIIGCDKLYKRADNVAYNNGICTECNNGYWKYSQAIGTRYGTKYIYFCDNCNANLETYNFMK